MFVIRTLVRGNLPRVEREDYDSELAEVGEASHGPASRMLHLVKATFVRLARAIKREPGCALAETTI